MQGKYQKEYGGTIFSLDVISYVVLNDFLLCYLEGKLMIIIIIPMEKTFSRAIDVMIGENEVDDLLTRTKKCAPISTGW